MFFLVHILLQSFVGVVIRGIFLPHNIELLCWKICWGKKALSLMVPFHFGKDIGHFRDPFFSSLKNNNKVCMYEAWVTSLIVVLVTYLPCFSDTMRYMVQEGLEDYHASNIGDWSFFSLIHNDCTWILCLIQRCSGGK